MKGYVAPRFKRWFTQRKRILPSVTVLTKDKRVKLACILSAPYWTPCLSLLKAYQEFCPNRKLKIYFRSDSFRDFSARDLIVTQVPTTKARLNTFAHELTHTVCHDDAGVPMHRAEYEACKAADTFCFTEKAHAKGREYVGHKIDMAYRRRGRRFDRESMEYATWGWSRTPEVDIRSVANLYDTESRNWSQWHEIVKTVHLSSGARR